MREGVEGSSIADVVNSVGDKVSTPVLLQAMEHLSHRENINLRMFFPKGAKARAKAIPNTLPSIPKAECVTVVSAMRQVLKQRFSAMEPLGKVYVDPRLVGYNLPFSQRSASAGGLKTIVRGSRIPIDSSATVIRLFLHWKNYQNHRTDVDMSAALLDAGGNHVGTCAYYDRGGRGIYHSGDIVDAPHGASEFIDININEMKRRGVRYVCMTAHVYCGANFCHIPECFVGWMEREKAGSGEVFDARAVKHKIDVTADSNIFLPAVFDVETREVVWCDLELKTSVNWASIGNAWGINVGGNNLQGSINATSMLFRATLETSRPKVYDLLAMHAEARGKLVDNPEEADVVFSEETGIQYELETLASEYMK
jgi:hypothetical protein